MKSTDGMRVIVTQGPYSTFFQEIAELDLVEGIRLNTIMPVKEGDLRTRLALLRDMMGGKPLWIDLKARQLRVREFANTPYTAVTVSHRIQVDLPATVCFDNGNLSARIVEVDEYRLILEGYAGRMLGPGESVNILEDSLEYLDPDVLTARDLEYVAACREVGHEHYMLSFVESVNDVEALHLAHPGCQVVAKLENGSGLNHMKAIADVSGLMAARGDLYTEVPYPHDIVRALRTIREVGGPEAIVASRILLSLLRGAVPSSPDIMDVAFLLEMGYRRFMIGDDICFNRDILLRALRILQAMSSA
jgi:hypothetical protein